MILVFGGTTEGIIVAKLLDFIDEPYYYSTKTQGNWDIKGKSIYGEMNTELLSKFCVKYAINVIINAAHPFAVVLHKTIHTIVTKLKIESIRYERIFPLIPQNNSLIKTFYSYEDLNKLLLESRFKNILFLTGVQTIPFFKKVWESKNAYFRILDTALSIQKAKQTGIPNKYILPGHPDKDVIKLESLIKSLNIEIIISKESGLSGFFNTKVEVSKKTEIPLWIIKRPELPQTDYTVYSKKELLQLIYRLRKTVLNNNDILQKGFTTGTCVLAAVKACFYALINNQFPDTIEVKLENAIKAKFIVFKKFITSKKAACTVIKNGGDDPDVTHGKEIGCELVVSEKLGFRFLKGKGVGMVTLPGLPVNVGEPAINPAPRRMITSMLQSLSSKYEINTGFDIIPFVPEGEALATQTFNPRIGVLGGISIIGTSGIVVPYSNEAFLSSIKQQLMVAIKTGNKQIVITSGKRSENMIRENFPDLSEQAFIHFGNLIGETIEMAVKNGIKQINLAIMFGKAIKLAEGYLNTHSKHVVFNPKFAAQIAQQCGINNTLCDKIAQQKIANAILKFIPFSKNNPFYKKIAEYCYESCVQLLPDGCSLSLILLSNSGNKIVYGRVL